MNKIRHKNKFKTGNMPQMLKVPHDEENDYKRYFF